MLVNKCNYLLSRMIYSGVNVRIKIRYASIHGANVEILTPMDSIIFHPECSSIGRALIIIDYSFVRTQLLGL